MPPCSSTNTRSAPLARTSGTYLAAVSRPSCVLTLPSSLSLSQFRMPGVVSPITPILIGSVAVVPSAWVARRLRSRMT
ncbi:hypothetical protein D3C71_1662230 [compost metagenome]